MFSALDLPGGVGWSDATKKMLAAVGKEAGTCKHVRNI